MNLPGYSDLLFSACVGALIWFGKGRFKGINDRINMIETGCATHLSRMNNYGEKLAAISALLATIQTDVAYLRARVDAALEK